MSVMELVFASFPIDVQSSMNSHFNVFGLQIDTPLFKSTILGNRVIRLYTRYGDLAILLTTCSSQFLASSY